MSHNINVNGSHINVTARVVTESSRDKRVLSRLVPFQHDDVCWFKQYLLDQPNTCTIGVQYYNGLLIIVLCTITP